MESQGSNPPKALKFVILRHQRPQDTHWDLMLEQPGSDLLATWQIRLPPEHWTSRLPATRLPDHRRIYLDYEGEISGNRGHVTRVDEGTAEVLATGNCWRLRLHGKHLQEEFWLNDEHRMTNGESNAKNE